MLVMRFVSLVVLMVALGLRVGAATDSSNPTVAKAAQMFGDPLNAEHSVFQLNDAYVVWLIFDTQGNLFQVDVGPKSYYTTEFPNAKKPATPEHLSETEYRGTLRRISELKEIGALQEGHGSATSSDFGPLNTDRFERAFVDRIVETDDADSVTKFNLYFLQDMAGSPERVVTMEPQPMVCLVGVWYYLPPEEAKTVQLGKWQSLRAAGPNLHGTTGCVRTTVLHDDDGFTIEDPQNETIVVPDLRVKEIAGTLHVSYTDIALEGANFEIRLIGSKRVLRTLTDARGAFSFSGIPDGKYKFKITKDGFKALSGFIFVDREGPEKTSLSLELPVGT
jgi:hypothetical protein